MTERMTSQALTVGTTMSTYLLFAFFCVGPWGSSVTADELWRPPKKKIVAVCPYIPVDPKILRENVEKFEKDIPFDGFIMRVVLPVIDNGAKKEFHGQGKSNGIRLTKEHFTDYVENLKNTNFRQLRHNFLCVNSAQFSNNWFDDQSWDRDVNNHSLVAWAAKNANFKGVVLDVEAYPFTERIFQFRPQHGHSFEETYAKARERGRQYMRAVGTEFPEIVLFTYFSLDFFYYNAPLISSSPMEMLKSDQYGLLAAFMNGMYDAIPPGAKIVDGHEMAGYAATKETDFKNVIDNYYRRSRLLVAPENLNKYVAQTSLSIATYNDAYVSFMNEYPAFAAENDHAWLFARNLRMAVEYSDEYAWTYAGGEGIWWDSSVVGNPIPEKFKLFDKLVPGMKEAYRYAKNPVQTAVDRFNKQNPPNMLENAAFAESDTVADGGESRPLDVEKSPYPHWDSWQRSSLASLPLLKGVFSLDATVGCQDTVSAKFSNVRDGCIYQKCPVAPGQLYLARAYCKVGGTAISPRFSIAWMDASKKWIFIEKNIAASFPQKENNGWKEAMLVADVPEGAAFLAVLCSSKASPAAELTPADACWFDNVGLYRIEGLGRGENHDK